MDFAEFLAPFDAGTFRSQYFGRQPLDIRRNGKGSGMLPLKERTAIEHAIGARERWIKERRVPS